MRLQEPDSATPVTPEERRELFSAHIAYRRGLNEAEQENITRAQDRMLSAFGEESHDSPKERVFAVAGLLGDEIQWA